MRGLLQEKETGKGTDQGAGTVSGEEGMKLSRRSMLRSAPVAALAAPMTATAIAKESIGGFGGPAAYYGSAIGQTSAVPTLPRDFIENEIRSLLKHKTALQNEKREKVNGRYEEACRLDAMRSLSATARSRMLREYDERESLRRELSSIERRIEEITKEHPFVTSIIKAMGVLP